MSAQFYVYILASKSRHLYVGQISNLMRRWLEHRSGIRASAQARDYRVFHLVYYELVVSRSAALWRERQVKNWRREKRTALINAFNPGCNDLAVRFWVASLGGGV